MEERLQKILSRYGVASRRRAETLLLDGRVRVNGNTASLGDTADPERDVIQVDGVRLKKPPEFVYILLNKPRGYVTTLADERGRKQVSQLVEGCGERVYPVGRLDMYSEGLLLMTNDGALANGLMHPGRQVDKVYHVWVSNYEPEAMHVLTGPMELDGMPIRPARATVLMRKEGQALLRMTIHEGKNRQIRKMCAQAGLTVTRLQRVSEGPVKLGELKVGAWRHLSKEEVAALKRAAYGK